MHFGVQQQMQKSNMWRIPNLRMPETGQALLLLLIIAITLQRTTAMDATVPPRWQSSNVPENASAAINATANENNFEQIVLQKLEEEQAERMERMEQGSLQQQSSSSSTELLSRKRRYLIFPEGSSFQVVYDLIVGWVDLANYLVLGVTVALAWQLPTETPNAVLESLQDRLKDGSLGVRRNDTVSKITYVDTKPKHKPNYINLAQTQTYGNVKPAYNYYTNTNTNRRVLPAFHVPMHQKYYNYNNFYRPSDSYYRPSRRKYVSYQSKPGAYQRNKYGYYTSPKQHPFSKWNQKPAYSYAPKPASGAAAAAKYPWWNLASRLSDSIRASPRPPAAGRVPVPVPVPARRVDNLSKSKGSTQKQSQQQRQQQNRRTQSGYFQSKAAMTRKHRIYPVFGKRSIRAVDNDCNNSTEHISCKASTPSSSATSAHHRARRNGIAGPELSKLDRIHIRYQRSSRQTLYDKIEKYLDRRGSHGQHCVLRALCETAKKHTRDRQPGSFVGELMRTVFTMPESLEEDVEHYLLQQYDTASAYSGECTARYYRCKDSLWKSEFVL